MRIILLIAALIVGWGCSRSKGPTASQPKSGVEKNAKLGETQLLEIEERADGRFYLKSNGLVFTGKAVDRHANGKVKHEVLFSNGLKDGSEFEYNADGQLSMRRGWRKGRLIIEQSGDNMRAAEKMLKERAQRDQNEWRSETRAQDYEETFVNLADNLRNHRGEWGPLKAFAFRELSVPSVGLSKTLDWGIHLVSHDGATKTVTPSRFREHIAAAESDDIRLMQSEWHMGAFREMESGVESDFNFTLHTVRDQPAKRWIIRGMLTVKWAVEKDSGGHFAADSIVVSNLRVLEREGKPVFETMARVDPGRLARAGQKQAAAMPLLAYDLDRNGFSEIILPASNLVFWNQGEGKVTGAPLFPKAPRAMDGATLADFTGDGFADMFVLPREANAQLYIGDARGRFIGEPRQIVVPVEHRGIGYVCPAGDIDGDGDLDIFVTQYQPPYVKGQFPTPFYDANDGWPACLLLNDGKGNFSDGTASAGLEAKRYRRTYSSSFVDLDDDDDLDLVVINDFAGLDVYLNDGLGKFTDVTDQLGEDRFSFGMSHALADFDRDGHLDLYMTGMGSTTARRLESMGLGRRDFPGHQEHRLKLGYGNRLFLGGAKGLEQAHYNDLLARTGWSWGCAAFDFDSDGDEDLYVANGHLSRKSYKDYCTTFWRHDIYENTKRTELNPVLSHVFNSAQKSFNGDVSWNGFEHNVLFLNEGKGSFVNVSWLLGMAHEYDSRSVVSDDLDRDGRPDLIVTERGWDERTGAIPNIVHLYRNILESGNHWIGVSLHENGAGGTPLGARVTIQFNGRKHRRSIVTGDSYRSQHSNQLHFGLGAADRVDAIEVRWPNGQVSRLEKPAIDQYHTLSPKKANAP